MSHPLTPSAPTRAGFLIAGREREDSIGTAANAYETAFLAEMLKHSGLGKTSGALGDGESDSSFSHMLQEAYAKEIVSNGGIGLSEFLVKALSEQPA